MCSLVRALIRVTSACVFIRKSSLTTGGSEDLMNYQVDLWVMSEPQFLELDPYEGLKVRMIFLVPLLLIFSDLTWLPGVVIFTPIYASFNFTALFSFTFSLLLIL